MTRREVIFKLWKVKEKEMSDETIIVKTTGSSISE